MNKFDKAVIAVTTAATVMAPIANVKAQVDNKKPEVRKVDDIDQATKDSMYEKQKAVVDESLESLHQAQERLRQLESENENLSEGITNLENAIKKDEKTKKEALDKVNSYLGEDKKSLHDEKAKKEDLSNEKKSLSDKLESSKNEIVEKQKEADSIKEELADQSPEDVKELQKKIDKNDREVLEKKASIEKLEKSLNDVRSKQEELQKQIKNKTSQVEDAKKSVDDITEQIKASENGIENFEEQIKDVNDKIKDAENTLGFLDSQIQSADKTLKELNEDLAATESNDSQAAEKVQHAAEELISADSGVKEAKKTFDKANAEYENASKKHEEMSQSLWQQDRLRDEAYRINGQRMQYKDKLKEELSKSNKIVNMPDFYKYLQEKGYLNASNDSIVRKTLENSIDGIKVVQPGATRDASDIYNVLDGLDGLKYVNKIRKGFFDKWYVQLGFGTEERLKNVVVTPGVNFESLFCSMYNADKQLHVGYGHNGDIYTLGDCISSGFSPSCSAVDAWFWHEVIASYDGISRGEITWDDFVHNTKEYNKWIEGNRRRRQIGHAKIIVNDYGNKWSTMVHGCNTAGPYANYSQFYAEDKNGTFTIDEMQNLIVQYLKDRGVWNDALESTLRVSDAKNEEWYDAEIKYYEHVLNGYYVAFNDGKLQFTDIGDTESTFKYTLADKQRIIDEYNNAHLAMRKAQTALEIAESKYSDAVSNYKIAADEFQKETGVYFSVDDVLQGRFDKDVNKTELEKKIKEVEKAREDVVNQQKGTKERIKAFNSQVDELNKSIDKFKEVIKQKEDEKGIYSDRVKNLTDSVESLKKEKEALNSNVSEIESKIDSLNEAVDQKIAENDQLSEEIEKVMGEKEHYQKLKEKLDSIMNEIDSLKKDSEKIYDSIKENEAKTSEVDSKIKQLSDEIDSVNRALNEENPKVAPARYANPLVRLFAYQKLINENEAKIVDCKKKLEENVPMVDSAKKDFEKADEIYRAENAKLDKIASIVTHEEKLNAAKKDKINLIESKILPYSKEYTRESDEKAHAKFNILKEQAIAKIKAANSIEEVDAVAVPSFDDIKDLLVKVSDVKPDEKPEEEKPVVPEEKPETKPEEKPQDKPKEETKDESKDDSKDASKEESKEESKRDSKEEPKDETAGSKKEDGQKNADEKSSKTADTGDVSSAPIMTALISGIAAIFAGKKRKND